MPRKSSNVVAIDTRQNRLHPPANLDGPERDLFVALVAANAPTHFRDSDMPLLLQYCAAAVLSDRAMAELRAAPIIDGKPSVKVADTTADRFWGCTTVLGSDAARAACWNAALGLRFRSSAVFTGRSQR